MSTYPPEIEQFVQSQVALGRFPSREAFAIEAARRLMAFEAARERVAGEVQMALEEAAAGLDEQWDPESDKQDLLERLDEQGRPR